MCPKQPCQQGWYSLISANIMWSSKKKGKHSSVPQNEDNINLRCSGESVLQQHFFKSPEWWPLQILWWLRTLWWPTNTLNLQNPCCINQQCLCCQPQQQACNTCNIIRSWGGRIWTVRWKKKGKAMKNPESEPLLVLSDRNLLLNFFFKMRVWLLFLLKMHCPR